MKFETPETPEAPETVRFLLVKIDRHCSKIGEIHDDYRDMGTYGCAGEAGDILLLVNQLRALLGLPS